MKSSYIRYGAAAILHLIILQACSSDKGIHISFERIDTRKETRLTGDADSPGCVVEMAVHQAKGVDGSSSGKAVEAVNKTIVKELFGMPEGNVGAAMDSFACKYMHDYARAMGPLYANDRNDAERHSWYEYRYSIKTEVKAERKDVDTYIISTSYYEGGAHGIEQTRVINFNATTGSMIRLKDIFVPGYEARLTDMLFTALKKKTGTAGIIELQNKGYLCTTEMFVPENFMMTKDSIVFIYNIYEIAPYANGKTELSIPWKELSDIMKKEL